MPTLVVPFRGTDGKSRLEPLADEARAALANAMLADVLAAAAAVGQTFLVAPEPAASVVHVADPHRGQGVAVVAALGAAAAAGAAPPYLVVNVDTVDDLARLEPRLGPHTRRAFASLRRRAA